MWIATPDNPPSLKVAQARAISAVTTLLCFVVGVEAVTGSTPALRQIGLELLVIVGVAAVAAFHSQGVARRMLRWLWLLSGLQVVFWGWDLSAPTATPRTVSAVSVLALAGWLLAISRLVSELRAPETE
jgi:hypothetical protein